MGHTGKGVDLMESWQKTLTLILILTQLFLLAPVSQLPLWAAQEPQVSAEAAVLMDLNSGQVLWAKNEHQQRSPASTTKILTALIALEKGNLNDTVTISPEAVRVEGTRVYLVEGEKQSLENLLYAMMLNSANDAAYSIAEHVGGTVEAFSQLMNEKVKALGAQNSNFVTPSGLDEEGHTTTAYDLALITKAAMADPKFREIVATKTRPWQGAQWESTLINQNELLSTYEGTTGVKTGYTTKAKNCLVVTAERNGEAFLAVILGSPTKKNSFADGKALLDYAFNNFYTQPLAQKGEIVAQLELEGQALEVAPISNFEFLQSRENPIYPQEKLVLLPLKAPVAKGEKVGEIQYIADEQILGKVELVAQNDVANRTTLFDWWVRLTSAVFLGLLLILFVRFYNSRRKKRYGYYSSRSYRRFSSL